MLDADEAGQAASAEILPRLAQKVFVKVLKVTEGEQPDQFSKEKDEKAPQDLSPIWGGWFHEPITLYLLPVRYD